MDKSRLLTLYDSVHTNSCSAMDASFHTTYYDTKHHDLSVLKLNQVSELPLMYSISCSFMILRVVPRLRVLKGLAGSRVEMRRYGEARRTADRKLRQTAKDGKQLGEGRAQRGEQDDIRNETSTGRRVDARLERASAVYVS